MLQLLKPWNAAIAAFLGALLAFAGIFYALHHVAADFGLAALFTGCIVGAIVAGVVYVIARGFTQSATATRQRRALEAERAVRRARYDAAMATIDDPVARVAVEHLADFDNLGKARQIWCALGIGHEPTAHRAGAHPILYVTDTDTGFRAIPTGVELSVRLPDEYADPTRFINKLPALADMLYLDRIDHAGVDRGVHKIHIITRDPLVDAVSLLWPEDPAQHEGLDYISLLDALRVGMREDGEFLRMRIRGDHMLIAGVTGAGKSSALWSILAALGPAIRDGVVVVHMIDLKRGMEMAAGYRLYENFVWEVDPALELLEKLVKTVLAVRADERRENSMRNAKPNRKHVPRPGDPHHVLIIDELMALLKIPGKRVIEVMDEEGKTVKIKIVELAAMLLIELLTQARAIGLTIIMATQNAAKEVLDLLRDLIPSLVGMRLPSDQELMVFGRGARDQGVRCAEISADAQGTVFIKGEDGGPALRGRFFHVTDESIPHIVDFYGRPDDAAASATRQKTPQPQPQPPQPQREGSRKSGESATVYAIDNFRRSGNETRNETANVKQCARPSCTNPVVPTGRGRPPKYCSETCRGKDWRARRTQEE